MINNVLEIFSHFGVQNLDDDMDPSTNDYLYYHRLAVSHTDSTDGDYTLRYELQGMANRANRPHAREVWLSERHSTDYHPLYNQGDGRNLDTLSAQS